MTKAFGLHADDGWLENWNSGFSKISWFGDLFCFLHHAKSNCVKEKQDRKKKKKKQQTSKPLPLYFPSNSDMCMV